MLRTNYQRIVKDGLMKMDKLKIVIADDNRQIAEFEKKFFRKNWSI